MLSPHVVSSALKSAAANDSYISKMADKICEMQDVCSKLHIVIILQSVMDSIL